MTITVFSILLFAALLHASWNAIVKASGDKLSTAVGVSGSASLIALVMLPFSPSRRWPACRFCRLLRAAGGYTVLVAKTYQVSDMGRPIR